MALLRGGVRIAPQFCTSLIVGHVNHCLRGAESDADEAFVREVCSHLGVECLVVRTPLDSNATHRSEGIESLARTARYQALLDIAHRRGARYLLTAHTADDQAETILHRIVRGTGIGGLAGMSRARPLDPACTLVRPLLGFRRDELLAYLNEVDQSFRCDSSNIDPRFTRNRLRHDLLPRLAEEYNPAVVEAILRLGSLAREAQEVVDREVDSLFERCVEESEHGVRIAMGPLAGEPRHLVRQLLIAVWQRRHWPLQAMGYAEWDTLAEMLAPRQTPATVPQRMFPGGVKAESITSSGPYSPHILLTNTHLK